MQRLLRCPEVLKIVGLSRSRLYDLIRRGDFPPPIPVYHGARAVGWPSRKVEAWVEGRIAAAEQRPADAA
jgi:prophage regulatory protein